jgi:Family of unknown function (DUF6444)
MGAPNDTGSRDDSSFKIGSVAIIRAFQAENALLRGENAALTERLADLERRLGLNSSKSGKPPSSDGLKKPPRVSSKKTGGQKGHPATTLLRRTETPDATIDHYPEACMVCGEPLTAAMTTDQVARQAFDLPEPTPLIVTEHRAHDCRCIICGPQTRGIPRRGNRPASGRHLGSWDIAAAQRFSAPMHLPRRVWEIQANGPGFCPFYGCDRPCVPNEREPGSVRSPAVRVGPPSDQEHPVPTTVLRPAATV